MKASSSSSSSSSSSWGGLSAWAAGEAGSQPRTPCGAEPQSVYLVRLRPKAFKGYRPPIIRLVGSGPASWYEGDFLGKSPNVSAAVVPPRASPLLLLLLHPESPRGSLLWPSRRSANSPNTADGALSSPAPMVGPLTSLSRVAEGDPVGIPAQPSSSSSSSSSTSSSLLPTARWKAHVLLLLL